MSTGVPLDAPLLQPSSWPIYFLTALSCIGGFLFGYDTGVISGALVLIDDDFPLSDVQKELVVGMTVAGALASSLLAGRLSDMYGRVPVIIGSSISFLVGSLVLGFANSYTGNFYAFEIPTVSSSANSYSLCNQR